MCPHIGILVPWFIFFTKLKLADTYPGMIMTHLIITLPLTIWIMIGFFEEVPQEIQDMAMVDGCSTLGTSFISVYPSCYRDRRLDNLGFAFSWNNSLLSAIIGGPHTQTLPVITYLQVGEFNVDWGYLAASGIALTVPVLLLTLVVQRYLIRGLAFGGYQRGEICQNLPTRSCRPTSTLPGQASPRISPSWRPWATGAVELSVSDPARLDVSRLSRELGRPFGLELAGIQTGDSYDEEGLCLTVADDGRHTRAMDRLKAHVAWMSPLGGTIVIGRMQDVLPPRRTAQGADQRASSGRPPRSRRMRRTRQSSSRARTR